MLCPADLLNVFETFLPQLLLYPNPTDPLNGEAAALLMREPQAYNAKVKGAFWLPQSVTSKTHKQMGSADSALKLLIRVHCSTQLQYWLGSPTLDQALSAPAPTTSVPCRVCAAICIS